MLEHWRGLTLAWARIKQFAVNVVVEDLMLYPTGCATESCPEVEFLVILSISI
jgi:hypothetical protein